MTIAMIQMLTIYSITEYICSMINVLPEHTLHIRGYICNIPELLQLDVIFSIISKKLFHYLLNQDDMIHYSLSN